MGSSSNDDSWIWSQYWASRRLACCLAGDAFDQYDPEIVSFWSAFFAQSPDGARVLDVCTGNGAVALIAADVGSRENKAFEITGVDKAAIDPARAIADKHPLIAGIAFLPRCDIAALPFDDARFDVVTSQFGLEYADWRACLSEIRRVMRPGARFAALLHAREGDIWRLAASERVAIDAKGADRVIDAAIAFCDCDEDAARTGANRAKRKRREAALATLTSRLQSYEAVETGREVRAAAAGLIRSSFEALPHHGHRAVRAKLEEVRESVRAHDRRTAALLDHALSEAEADELAQRLTAAGVRCERPRLFRVSGARAAGWVVTGQRTG